MAFIQRCYKYLSKNKSVWPYYSTCGTLQMGIIYAIRLFSLRDAM